MNDSRSEAVMKAEIPGMGRSLTRRAQFLPSAVEQTSHMCILNSLRLACLTMLGLSLFATWVGAAEPVSLLRNAFINSLGMKFVSVPGTTV